MHPQVESQKFHSCLDLVQALEKCHQAEFYKKAFGYCNNEKEALTRCLVEARKSSAKDNFLRNRERRRKIDEKWKQCDEEQYGEDAILKKIIERETARRANSGAK